MSELLAAADALRALVCGCYGPYGEEVLVFAPPDPPVITSDGHSVLRAWKARDTVTLKPFERAILGAAEGVYQEAGDGSVQFILLLHSILSHVAEYIDRQTTSTQQTTVMRVQTARAFAVLRQRLAEEMLRQVRRWTLVEEIEKDTEDDGCAVIRPSLLHRIRQVLTTALSGMLGQHAVQHIVSLVMQWVFTRLPLALPSRSPVHRWFSRVQAYVKHAPEAIIHAQGGALADSAVVPPGEFILRKSLVPSQLPSLLSSSHCVRFVCLLGALDLVHGSNAIKLDCRNAGNMDHQAVYAIRQLVLRFVTSLKAQYGVHLIVSSEKIEDYAAAMCSQLGMACVQYAERENVVALCSAAGIYPLGSILDDVSEVGNVGVSAEGVTSVRLSQTPSIRFRGLRRRRGTNDNVHTCGPIPQIILCATSKGVYKQYYSAICKCLRVIRALFANATGGEYERLVFFCRGAGATELILARLLRQEELKMGQEGSGDLFSRLVRRALATAMVEGVAQLRTNVAQVAGAHPRDQRWSSRNLHENMSLMASSDEQWVQGYVVDMTHSIPTVLGSINAPATIDDADPIDYGILHPWRRFDTIIHSVLQTAEMLLRVDAVVHVKKHPRLLAQDEKTATVSEDD